MPTTLVLFHDSHFDLVNPDDLGDQESLGVYKVLTPDGEEQRHKVAVDSPGNTTYVEVPDDFQGTPIELVHLVQTLGDRHAAADNVTALSSSDPVLGRKIAALLGLEGAATHDDADKVLADAAAAAPQSEPEAAPAPAPTAPAATPTEAQ
jgi:hypothetical protein